MNRQLAFLLTGCAVLLGFNQSVRADNLQKISERAECASLIFSPTQARESINRLISVVQSGAADPTSWDRIYCPQVLKSALGYFVSSSFGPPPKLTESEKLLITGLLKAYQKPLAELSGQELVEAALQMESCAPSDTIILKKAYNEASYRHSEMLHAEIEAARKSLPSRGRGTTYWQEVMDRLNNKVKFCKGESSDNSSANGQNKRNSRFE